MTPSNVQNWWEFLAHAPLSMTLLLVAGALLYVTYKFLFHVVSEIRTTLTVNSMLRDELVRKLKEREDYIAELENLVDDLKELLRSKGIKYASDE